MPQLIFGGILAVILLGFYIWSIVDAIFVVQCEEERLKDASKICEPFTTNMTFFLNSIGALIAATVVGVLGSTKVTEFPGRKLFGKNLTGIVQTFAAYMPSVYILVWMVCGVFTVIYGFGLYDTDHVKPFTEHAKSWLGAAIAAVFAYFGINPDGNPVERPAIASISIDPATTNLTSAKPTQKLSATATDAQNNPIGNLPSDRFQWTSDNPSVAMVDQTGLVTWVAPGNCNVTAAASTVISNGCAVICS